MMFAKAAVRWMAVTGSALFLAACGGSSGSSSASQTTCLPTMANPDACAPQLAMLLFDSTGNPTLKIAPDESGTLVLTLKSSTGAAVPNALVAVSTSDSNAVLSPAAGTALTDAAGVARVGISAGSAGGAYTATASATYDSYPVAASVSYAVTVPSLSLSALTATPSTLSAGGTASLAVTVLDNGSPYRVGQAVSFSSPCSVAGRASITSPVVTVNGVASASYTDKGCGVADTVTATTTLSSASASRTVTLNVLPATAGQIAFVSALPQNIALKGTGGPGRQESAVVTFKVLDRNGNPVGGTTVDFLLIGGDGATTGTGGLSLTPASGMTSSDGLVATTVQAGTVNTPVRVSATVRNSSPLITSVSDQLVVSTGIPDQDSFSLSTAIYNVEGGNYDGCDTPVGSTVRISLADHFNNPVPDGTAVSFTAEGGTVDASCLSGLANTQLTSGGALVQKGVPGVCTVRFCPSSPRPADGRVTVMAYALGEESFLDDPAKVNGVNRYDSGESFQDLCEPFRNDRALLDRHGDAALSANSTVRSANAALGEAACPTPRTGEVYIDTNANGVFDARGNGVYNGVLNIDPATGQTVPNSRTSSVHVRASLVQVLSTSEAAIDASVSPIDIPRCVDGTTFSPSAQTVLLYIRDRNPTIFPGNTYAGNILPAGTRIEISTSNGKLLGATDFKVPNTNAYDQSAWTYAITVQSDATQSGAGSVCGNAVSSGLLTVRVTTPMGVITTASFPVRD